MHSTWFLFFGHEGFQVIADDDGQILTDMELLAYLRNVRSKIMKTENKPAYTIIGNKGLVSLATYRPENREEFIALYGLGETTYNSHGLQFIQAIKDFEKKFLITPLETPKAALHRLPLNVAVNYSIKCNR